LALIVALAATCDESEPVGACPTPEPGSTANAELLRARNQSAFPLLYPCRLPLGEALVTTAVTGQLGQQRVELVFGGPFDMTLRQSQVPPPQAPDPTGASRITIDLFSNVRATLIERNDGSQNALYHLFWSQNNLYYELQVTGPPLQRATVLEAARSLQ
jgi:hypothetical protein